MRFSLRKILISIGGISLMSSCLIAQTFYTSTDLSAGVIQATTNLDAYQNNRFGQAYTLGFKEQYNLNTNFALSAGLNYMNMKIRLNTAAPLINPVPEASDYYRYDINSHYINLPISLQFGKIKLEDHGFFGFAGMETSLFLGASKKITFIRTYNNQITLKHDVENSSINLSNGSSSIGFNYNIGLSKNFKLGSNYVYLGLSYTKQLNSWGFADNINIFTNHIKFKNRGIALNAGFYLF